MTDLTRTIFVFLASPGEVEAERQAAASAVERVNRTIGRPLRMHLEVLRWEDKPPEVGRPQALINADLDRADVFIGILGFWWGSPTGEYSSGFEEEFERAFERHDESGSPQMWLYTKRIPDDRGRDPGESLSKVIEFRDRVEAEQRLLFKPFDAAPDLEQLLVDQMSAFMVELGTESFGTGIGDAGASTGPPAAEGPAKPPPAEPAGPAQRQLQALLQIAAKAVPEDDPPRDGGRIDRKAISRLYLLFATWMSRAGGSATLPTHEANVIYREREDSVLSPWEGFHVLRTLLVEDEPSRPGWGLLSDWKDEGLISLIADVAIGDSEADVRVGAARVLRSAGLAEKVSLEDVSALVSDDKPHVRLAGYQLAAAIPGEGARDLLRAAERETHADIDKDSREALFDRLVKESPIEALDLIDRNPHLASAEAFSQHGIVPLVDRVRLLLRHTEGAVRRFALELGARPRGLRRRDVEPLLQDEAARVRNAAVRAILTRKWQVEDNRLLEALQSDGPEFHSVRERNELRREVLARKSKAALEEALGSLAAGGADAYVVLATRHFGDFGEIVRRDLGDAFDSLRELMLDQLRTDYPDVEEAALRRRFRLTQRDEEILFEYLTRAAMEALAAHGSADDLPLAHQYLTSGIAGVQAAALKIYGRFGSYKEAQELLVLSREPGYFGAIAARTIAEIGSRDRRVVREGLSSDITEVQAAIMRSLLQKPDAELELAVLPLLGSENWWLRKAAVAFLAEIKQRAELQQLLADYYDRSYFYYNVIAWLDRVLYAPPSLRPSFLRALRGP